MDVTDLVVTDLDLGLCRFDGAHHLDKLRLEGDCTFGIPSGRLRFGLRWLPMWRWTQRQVLAEECDWRTTTGAKEGWPQIPIPAETPDSPPTIAALNPKRVAALYRDLRKALEDSKNEPGAADFYYGEMEMRRNDRSAAGSERLALHLYWMIAGYGLRAIRALACLAGLITVVAILLEIAGYAPPLADAGPGFAESLLYSAQFAVFLDKPTVPKLTGQGEVIRLVMRLLGPLFLGLALLAIRNRVKR